MPTYLVGPSRPYTNLHTAFAAIPSDLTGTGVHEVIIDAGTYTNNTLLTPYTLSKSNGSATDYVIIRSADNSRHGGLFTSGVILTANGSFGIPTTLLIETNYTIVRDIVVFSVYNVPAGGTCIGLTSLTNSNNCLLENVLFNGRGRYGIRISGQNCKFYKCLGFMNISGGSGSGFVIENSNHSFINCGDYGGDAGFASTGRTNIEYINCWAANTIGADFSIGVSATVSSRNNASEDSTAPGPNSRTNLTISQMGFVSTALNNFHLTESSVLIATGFDQSHLFIDDFEHDVIGLWCIGPDYAQIPQPVATTSSSPWVNQNEPHDEVEDATPPTLKTKQGEPSDSLDPQVRHRDAKPPKLKTQSPQSSKGLDASSDIRDASSTAKGIPKGYKDGFLSVLPEVGGYQASSVTYGTGNRIPFTEEDFRAGQAYQELFNAYPSRQVRFRADLGTDPEGGFTAPIRTNDCIPVFQSHFQKRIGTTPAVGTTYYEFSPCKSVVMAGSSFGTGSFTGVGSFSAFTVSAYKAINGSSYLFSGGVCDSITFELDANRGAYYSPNFVFQNVQTVATNLGLPYGSYSTLKTFSGPSISVDFLSGLNVNNLTFESKNLIGKFRTLGSDKIKHRIGMHSVKGVITTDLEKAHNLYLFYMQNSITFQVMATVYDNERNKMVFDMPFCMVNSFDIKLTDGFIKIPFTAYEFEDGSYPALTVKLWTTGYSATSFQPN